MIEQSGVTLHNNCDY